MKTFRLVAEFTAEDVDDAFARLAAHFAVLVAYGLDTEAPDTFTRVSLGALPEPELPARRV